MEKPAVKPHSLTSNVWPLIQPYCVVRANVCNATLDRILCNTVCGAVNAWSHIFSYHIHELIDVTLDGNLLNGMLHQACSVNLWYLSCILCNIASLCIVYTRCMLSLYKSTMNYVNLMEHETYCTFNYVIISWIRIIFSSRSYFFKQVMKKCVSSKTDWILYYVCIYGILKILYNVYYCVIYHEFVFSDPSAVTLLVISATTNSSLSIDWESGFGSLDRYEVRWKDLDADSTAQTNATLNDEFLISKLTPGNSYVITVWAVFQDKFSTGEQLVATTSK